MSYLSVCYVWISTPTLYLVHQALDNNNNITIISPTNNLLII